MKCTFLLLAFLLLFSCKAADIDKETIKVGAFTWMSHDLNTIIFQNGDTLQCADDSVLWCQLCDSHIPAYCHIPYQSDSVGLLYNYWAMKDERNIAPQGWHVAKKEEWQYAISIDSMNLYHVEDIYKENRLNIQRKTTICGNSESYFYNSKYWAWDAIFYAVVYVYEEKDTIPKEFSTILTSSRKWSFGNDDIVDENYEFVKICPYRGLLIRCVKDY